MWLFLDFPIKILSGAFSRSFFGRVFFFGVCVFGLLHTILSWIPLFPLKMVHLLYFFTLMLPLPFPMILKLLLIMTEHTHPQVHSGLEDTVQPRKLNWLMAIKCSLYFVISSDIPSLLAKHLLYAIINSLIFLWLNVQALYFFKAYDKILIKLNVIHHMDK